VKPPGARTFVSGRTANAETEVVRNREAGTSSRTNETRVLEIEAVDGRNRSHASRERDARGRKAACATRALVFGLRGQPPGAARGRIQRRNGVRVVLVFKSNGKDGVGRGRELETCSIRWKTFWVVATSSLHRGGASAALASRSSSRTSSKGGGLEENALGAIARAARATSSLPHGGGRGCLRATRERQRSAAHRGEGSPSGNNARRVRVASDESRASIGSSRF
jgi:hypothetical protein